MIAGWRRKEKRPKHLQGRQENHKSNEPSTMSRVSIQHSGPAEQHSHLQRKRRAAIVPQPKSHLAHAVIKSKIRAMNDEIENPVRKHSRSQDQSSPRTTKAWDKLANRKRQHRPAQHPEQAVRIWHVIQVERVGSGNARNDAHLLNSQQDEDRPQHINELYGDKQQPQRNTFLCGFGGEANAVVTYKQEMLLIAFPSMPLGVPLRYLCRIHNRPRDRPAPDLRLAIVRRHPKNIEPLIVRLQHRFGLYVIANRSRRTMFNVDGRAHTDLAFIQEWQQGIRRGPLHQAYHVRRGINWRQLGMVVVERVLVLHGFFRLSADS